MTTQADFGNAYDPATMVPGSLRGYRYFKRQGTLFLLDSPPSRLTGRRIRSMQYDQYWEPLAWAEATCAVSRNELKLPGSCWRGPRCKIDRHRDGTFWLSCYCDLRPVKRLKPFDFNWFTMADDPYPYVAAHETEIVYEPTVHQVSRVLIERHPGKNSPQSDCTCGFYASYYADSSLGSAPGTTGAIYLGAIEAAGKVILGTKGFRAERMRVLALAPVEWARKYGGNRYPPPPPDFEWHSTEADLLAAYPPEDVSELLPKPKPEPEPEWVDLGMLSTPGIGPIGRVWQHGYYAVRVICDETKDAKDAQG